MRLNIEMVTFDCADPAALSAWWAEQVEGEVSVLQQDEFHLVSHAGGPILGFQKVPDPVPGKNRLHLDLSAADVDAEVARLVAAGASETGRHTFGPYSWVVLDDPAGNAFCVVAREEGADVT